MPHAKRQTGVARRVCPSLALAGILLLAPAAAPAAGGAPEAPGGVGFVPQPVVKKVGCAKSCSQGRPRVGGTVKLSGARLTGVSKVVFEGAPGAEDDAAVAVRPASDSVILAKVPQDAATGPLRVYAGAAKSKATAAVSVLPPPPLVPRPQLTPGSGIRDAGAPQLETAVAGVHSFYGAEQPIAFSYRLSTATRSVQIALVRLSNGKVVNSWTPAPIAPGQIGSVSWNGVAADGSTAPEGRYAFRIQVEGDSGAKAVSAQSGATPRDAFDHHAHIFPIRGAHSYGSAINRFGGGRGHKGHDTFAKCGTPLVAARGGKVTRSGFDGHGGGNYIVIDADGTSFDHDYMHLRQPSPFRVGDHVYTGQQIGQVGDTGNAVGCHLHFEIWSGSWFGGGRPVDPLPYLKAWDAYS